MNIAQHDLEEIKNPFQLEIPYDDASKTKNNIIEVFLNNKKDIQTFISSRVDKGEIYSNKEINTITTHYLNPILSWLWKIEHLIKEVPYLERIHNDIKNIKNHMDNQQSFWNNYDIIKAIHNSGLLTNKEDCTKTESFLEYHTPEHYKDKKVYRMIQNLKMTVVLNYHFYAPSKEKLEDSDQMVVQSLWLLWTSNSKRDDNTAHIADNIYNSTTLQQDEITELRKRFVYLYFVVSKSNIDLIPKETYNMILKELWDDRPQTLYKFQTTDQWNTYMEARHKTSLSYTPSP